MVSPDFDIRPSILVGDTADVFLHRTLSILRDEGLNPHVSMEFSPSRAGIFCGLPEVWSLLQKVLPESGVEVWALEEGEAMEAREVALRINAPYSTFGLYETALCGTLASCSGWATAARECVDAANGLPVLAMGARHMHPNVAAVLDYSAVTGGCASCSTMQGGRLARVTPAGSMPHVLPLLMGDTLSAIEAFDRRMPSEIPRIALVDTFRDEAEEAIRVASVLKDRLRGIVIDTARERGGVGAEFVREVRARLDQAGHRHVEIYVSGGFTAEKIREFVQADAPVHGFAVGEYIASAPPNSFTADIHEIEGRPASKRGRIPGQTDNPHLNRII